MDGLYPMMYFDGQHFYPFAVNWKEYAYGRPVVPGLGAYQLAPERAQLVVAANHSPTAIHPRRRFPGRSYFRSQFLLDNVKGLLDFVHDNYAPSHVYHRP